MIQNVVTTVCALTVGHVVASPVSTMRRRSAPESQLPPNESGSVYGIPRRSEDGR
ncbi:hypothetical protein [Micromonospora luteifusca]|uniref:hypothetical protein n=1 Tax=Micromonospora luteifusca TaxID=709860 RepID=UPI0033A9A20D